MVRFKKSYFAGRQIRQVKRVPRDRCHARFFALIPPQVTTASALFKMDSRTTKPRYTQEEKEQLLANLEIEGIYLLITFTQLIHDTDLSCAPDKSISGVAGGCAGELQYSPGRPCYQNSKACQRNEDA